MADTARVVDGEIAVGQKFCYIRLHDKQIVEAVAEKVFEKNGQVFISFSKPENYFRVVVSADRCYADVRRVNMEVKLGGMRQ
jgi:hypothetical protein